MKYLYTIIILFIFGFHHSYSTQKVIIIGASSGIGAELARQMAACGYQVGIAGRRVELLEKVTQDFPENIISEYMDVNKPEEAKRVLDNLIARMGGMDCIVLSAACWPEITDAQHEGLLASSKQIPWNAQEITIATNVTGFTALATHAFNYFLEQGSGHLVGISSVDCVKGHHMCPAYSASKAFISNFMEGMRNKFIQLNIPIAITDIRPGFVATHEIQNDGYWVASPQEAAAQILEAIKEKKKVAYVTKRWIIVAALMQILPDWLYNWMGGL
ncbi:SDR family NAD(P)-dependent oxidoreductase [soil metagenome]